MKSIVLLMLFITAVELIDLDHFSNELQKSARLNNYEVVIVDWDEPLLAGLIRDLELPKTIYKSICSALSSSRVLYFLHNITDPSKNFTACIKPHVLPIIFYRNTSDTSQAIRSSSALLRKLRISKAFHVVYSPITPNLTLIPYGFLQFDEPQSIASLASPSPNTNLRGHVYTVHYTKLYPFTYHVYSSKGHKVCGLDQELIETVATFQNATISYVADPRSFEPCPSIQPTADLNIRRSGCLVVSADRLYLPDWDGVCVMVPKRHERPVMLQFTKPFLPEVWIFVCIYLVVRFFLHFNRLPLLLLAVVMIDFMLTASYEVKVIEYMATLRYAPNPRTMTDLINRGELFVVGPKEVNFLKTYGSAIRIKVVDISKETYLGKAALLYFCMTAESLMNTPMNYNPRTNDRIMIMLPQRLSPYPTSFGFTMGHPLRERFERMLGRVFETGIWRKIYDKYADQEQQFQPLMAPNEYLIEFGDFVPLWMVCGLGWTTALGAFVAEMGWEKYKISTRKGW